MGIVHLKTTQTRLCGDGARLRQLSAFDYLWLVACAGMFAFLVSAFWGETYDDVFLAYQYAKNIESGHGFVFNVGEHFLGTPAPLFVLLLVAVHAILPFLTIPHIGTLISCAGLSVTALALYGLGRAGGQRLLGAAIGVMAVFNPFTLLVLGGESPVYLALVAGAFWALAERRPWLVGILLGLAGMNRTEAIVPIGVILLFRLISERRMPWATIVAILCTVMPWLLYAYWEFGSPLSNSFVAKVSQVASGRRPFPFGLARWMYEVVFGQQPLLMASVIPGVFGFITVMMTPSIFRLVVLWALAQTAAYCCLPIPFYHWYAAQLGILGAILVGFGLIAFPATLRGAVIPAQERDGWVWGVAHSLCQRIARGRPAVRRILVGTILASGCVVAWASSKIVDSYDSRWPHSPANELYTKAGRWFAENTSKDARIAYLEIGQIAFYADRYIIDTLGLVTPGVAAEVAKRNWLWPIKKYKPDYIIYNQYFTKWPESGAIFLEPWFVDGYREVTRLSAVPYPFPLVIYERLPGAEIPDPG